MPAPSMRYQQLEAAGHFGIAIDDFLAKSIHRQAEMIAHLMIRSVRQDYAEHLGQQKAERASKKHAGFNPMEAQRRAWSLT